MKKHRILISYLSLLLILISCDNNSKINQENEVIKKLNFRIDSLENILKYSYDPIIFDINESKILHENDSLSFLTGLMLNNENCIDSLNLFLFKVESNKKKILIKRYNIKPSSDHKNRTYGIEILNEKNLKRGNYIYTGSYYLFNRKIDIEHRFQIFPN